MSKFTGVIYTCTVVAVEDDRDFLEAMHSTLEETEQAGQMYGVSESAIARNTGAQPEFKETTDSAIRRAWS